MKTQSKFIAGIVAASVSMAAIAPAAFAQDAVTTDTTQATQTAETGTLKIPAVGKVILNDIRSARVALFDGEIDAAKGIIGQAASYFGDKSAEYAIKLSDDDGFGLPVDSGIGFAEGFEPTQEHAPVIAKAGEHIQMGDHAGAIKTMSDAGIELSVQTVVVPFQSTVDNLEQAILDLDAGEVHKANMLLKSIETSIAVETFKTDAVPHQGYPLNEILPG